MRSYMILESKMLSLNLNSIILSSFQLNILHVEHIKREFELTREEDY